MKFSLFYLFLFTTAISLNSCSTDSTNSIDTELSALLDENFIYNEIELEEMKLINAHRVSIGLKVLQKIDYISKKAEEHNYYMIANNAISHDGFVARSESITKAVGAKSVSENLAYNYATAQEALTAWLNSPTHKVTIEGDFTHFGIAVRENTTTGKKYYTNIFVKI